MNRINVTETFLPPIEEYKKIISSPWQSKWLTNRGELVSSLEEKIHNHLNCYIKPLLVNNGTIALQVAIKALELKGEIITTPFSYVATTSSIVWENCTPVYVDIHPNFLTIDEDKIEVAITDKTSAILAVHVYGNPCAIEKIEEIANKHNLIVIYDAAHCFGIKYNGKSLFDYGDVSTCSFHATKLFHTGEGGAVFCNNSNFTETIFQHHNFGHNGPEDFHGLGINAKMNELNAAMGHALLPYMDQVIYSRKIASEYYDTTIKWDSIRKPELRKGTSYNYSYYPIIFESEEHLLSVQKKFNNQNIFPRRYFYPSLNKIGYTGNQEMEISEHISSCILCLPLFVGLEEKELDLICTILNSHAC